MYQRSDRACRSPEEPPESPLLDATGRYRAQILADRHRGSIRVNHPLSLPGTRVRSSLAEALFRPARRLPYEPRAARKPWLHPSVVPFLEAVLGPGRELEDDSVVWRVRD